MPKRSFPELQPGRAPLSKVSKASDVKGTLHESKEALGQDDVDSSPISSPRSLPSPLLSIQLRGNGPIQPQTKDPSLQDSWKHYSPKDACWEFAITPCCFTCLFGGRPEVPSPSESCFRPGRGALGASTAVAEAKAAMEGAHPRFLAWPDEHSVVMVNTPQV